VFYALQDEAFDRAHGLHSLPATLGGPRSILVARLLHASAVALLAAAVLAAPAGHAWMLAGVAVVGLLLVYEHSLVRANDLSRLDAAFFTMNGVISIAFLAFTLVARALR
jgi:4-hydroxybenzoate polyprenyltransferase